MGSRNSTRRCEAASAAAKPMANRATQREFSRVLADHWPLSPLPLQNFKEQAPQRPNKPHYHSLMGMQDKLFNIFAPARSFGRKAPLPGGNDL